MTQQEMQQALQQQLLTHFNQDVERTREFISQCRDLGLDLGDENVIKSISQKTPVFLNLLTHELWGTLPAFSRVVKELNNFTNLK